MKNAKRSGILRGLIIKGADYGELLEDLTEARRQLEAWMGYAIEHDHRAGHEQFGHHDCPHCNVENRAAGRDVERQEEVMKRLRDA